MPEPYCLIIVCFVCLMDFNTTFSNISVILWRSVLLVEETGGPGENHRPVASHWQTLMFYTSSWSRFELTTSVVIGTDSIGSCKPPIDWSSSYVGKFNNTQAISELVTAFGKNGWVVTKTLSHLDTTMCLLLLRNLQKLSNVQ